MFILMIYKSENLDMLSPNYFDSIIFANFFHYPNCRFVINSSTLLIISAQFQVYRDDIGYSATGNWQVECSGTNKMGGKNTRIKD